MPSFSRGNDGLDKEYFEELQEKCRFLGISLKEKDFRKNPDKYIEAARNYDERVKDYLHERQDRLKSLQEQFAREDNIPAFMALGKARMVLIGEVHRQMLAEKWPKQPLPKSRKNTISASKTCTINATGTSLSGWPMRLRFLPKTLRTSFRMPATSAKL